MTNYEWLVKENAELVKDCLSGSYPGSNGVAIKRNGDVDICDNTDCTSDCIFCRSPKPCSDLQRKWFEEKHNPYSIPLDTPIDTKVLVSSDGNTWLKRYFAGFDDSGEHYNKPYCTFDSGTTSWSVPEGRAKYNTSHWKYCTLAEDGEKQ